MQSNRSTNRYITSECYFVCFFYKFNKGTIMSSKNTLVTSAVASILLFGGALASTSAQAVPDQPKFWEKCAGVAKAGMNDCGSLDGKHGCSGQAKNNNAKNEWVYTPKGTCAKITGGRVAKIKPAKS